MPLAPGPGTWRQPDSPHYPAGPLGGAVHVAVGPRQLAARVPRQAIGPQPLYRAGRDTRVREGAGVTQPGTGASGFALRIRSCGSGLPGDFAGQLTGRPTE